MDRPLALRLFYELVTQKSLTIPSLINRATIAAREETWSLANIRRKCVQTVQGLISKTSAIALLG